MKFRNFTLSRVKALSNIIVVFIMAVVSMVQAQPPSHHIRINSLGDNNINGFWEYLPRNYDIDINQKYPLLIFFHGYGDSGSTSDSATLRKVLNAGTPRLISTGQFPETFTTADGKVHKFIVISPQIKNGFDDPTRSSNVAASTVDRIIEYSKTTYRVDPTRIYICGLSMGGGIAWDYAGSSVAAANKLAAIGVAAGATDIDTIESDNIAVSGLPVMATHNTIDGLILYTRTLANIAKVKASIEKLKNRVQPNITSAQDTTATGIDPVSVYWTTPGVGMMGVDSHNVWSRTFEDMQAGSTIGGNLRDSLGINVYEWLLKYDRSANGTLPVAWESFNILETNSSVLIQWVTSRELNVRNFTVEKSRDGINWIVLTTLPPRQSTGTLKAYSYSDNEPYPATSFYRIKQVDVDNKVTYSSIKVLSRNSLTGIKVFPNPFIQQISLDVPKVAESTTLNIKLTDVNGAVLRTMSTKVPAGAGSSFTLQGLQSLSRGMYYISVEDEEGKILVKKKVIKN